MLDTGPGRGIFREIVPDFGLFLAASGSFQDFFCALGLICQVLFAAPAAWCSFTWRFVDFCLLYTSDAADDNRLV